MSDQSSEKTNQNSTIARIALIGAGVVALLSLAPLLEPIFGESGLASAIPLPEEVATVGQALIPFVTLVMVVAIGLPCFMAKRAWTTCFFAYGTLLAGATLVVTYFSWVGDNGVILAPAVGPFASNVVAVGIFALALGFVTSGILMITGYYLLPKDSGGQPLGPSGDALAPTPLSEDVSETVIQRVTEHSAKHEIENPKWGVDELLVLVRLADWLTIASMSRHEKGIYWKIYGATARIVTDCDTNLRDLRILRLNFRLAGLLSLFALRNRSAKRTLLELAQGMMNYLTQRAEDQSAIRSFEGTSGEGFGSAAANEAAIVYEAAVRSLIRETTSPSWLLGHAQTIDTIRNAFYRVQNFRKMSEGNFVLLSKFQKIDGEYTFARSLNIGQGDAITATTDFWRELSRVWQGHSTETFSRAAQTWSKELTEFEEIYPVGSPARAKVNPLQSSAYCTVIAAEGDLASVDKLDAQLIVMGRAKLLGHKDQGALAEAVVETATRLEQDGVALTKFADNIREAREIMEAS